MSAFATHKVTPETAERMAELQGLFEAFHEKLTRMVGDGRCKALALTKLEECAMWANKAIAHGSPGSQPVPRTS